jgi:hypothetical protein
MDSTPRICAVRAPSEFEAWFDALGDCDQVTILENLRQFVCDAQIEVDYWHLRAYQETFATQDAFEIIASVTAFLSLN